MNKYIDGFVLPVPKDKLDNYQKIDGGFKAIVDTNQTETSAR